MRIWDIAPRKLCRNHLLGEHRELHAIWSILTKNKCGYRHHPEVLRWEGRLRPLYYRHESLVKELKRRGYRHFSPLDKRRVSGPARQDVLVDSISRQAAILKNKKCGCKI